MLVDTQLVYKTNILIRDHKFMFEVYNPNPHNDDELKCCIFDNQNNLTLKFSFAEQAKRLKQVLKPHIPESEMKLTELSVYKFIELDMRKQFIKQFISPRRS